MSFIKKYWIYIQYYTRIIVLKFKPRKIAQNEGEHMARPKGTANVKPTRSDIDQCWRTIKSAAANGDVVAAGQLIQLEQSEPATPSKEYDAGEMGAIIAAWVPRDDWHRFPADAQEFAVLFTRKIRELVEAGK